MSVEEAEEPDRRIHRRLAVGQTLGEAVKAVLQELDEVIYPPYVDRTTLYRKKVLEYVKEAAKHHATNDPGAEAIALLSVRTPGENGQVGDLATKDLGLERVQKWPAS